VSIIWSSRFFIWSFIEIILSYSGPDLEIGFNSKYLIDVGGVIEDKNMMIYAKDPSSPVLIHDPADINSLHVIMPMRVAWLNVPN